MEMIPETILNSGHKMPLVGMGTAGGHPLPPPEQLTSIIIDAITLGYRHFDTAALYGSEGPLGKAVAKGLEHRLIKNRDELFITSKLWCTNTHPNLVLPAITHTLRELDLSYVDLYLIHWPVTLKQDAGFPKPSEGDIVQFDMQSTWKAMGKCVELGLAKSIGVSNFSCAKLDKLLQHATIPPAVNQVEMNVVWQQGRLLSFCRTNNIHVSGWSPLGANGAKWGTERVMKSPVLQSIAAAKGKTLPQIALRWIHEQWASIIVKSFNKERRKENIQIFDWGLTDEELDQIKNISQDRGCTGHWFVHENGPYKSLDQLLDGEIRF